MMHAPAPQRDAFDFRGNRGGNGALETAMSTQAREHSTVGDNRQASYKVRFSQEEPTL